MISLYGCIYLLGFFVAFGGLCLKFRLSKAVNIAMLSAIGAICGGRLGYVLGYEPLYYLKNPQEILEIYKGGMSYHGGLLGILFILYFYCKNRHNFFKITDSLVNSALIIIPLGRIANFINGELWGTISYVPWAVIFEGADNFPRHPVQIYEALAEGPVLYLFIKLSLKIINLLKLFPVAGTNSALYLIGYGLLRALTEIFRESDVFLGRFGFLSLGQILCIFMILGGILMLRERLNKALILNKT